MKGICVTLAAGALAAAIGPPAPAQGFQHRPKSATNAGKSADLRGFDFLLGDWRVHHRRMTPDSREWVEFDGTCSHRDLMEGSANLDEYVLNAPAGTYRAVALRAYDAKTRQWAIWWLDGRYPSGPLDPPVRGRFKNGVGTFYSSYVQNGKPMRVRFIWSRITPRSARWEQALSSDAGKTWETNWMMDFQRTTPKPAQPAASRTGSRDFRFLVGDWRVHHRYIRLKAGGQEWLIADGPCDHRELMDGEANLDDYLIKAPSGVYRAVALRSYDPKTAQWAIWWLDGRNPAGNLDPPVKGRFENGVGTFYGDITLSGKPTRVRFIWSHVTPTSARWEQAHSLDAGKTWETNWIMTFQRVSPVD